MVIPGGTKRGRPRPVPRRAGWPRAAASTSWSVGVVVLCTLVCWAMFRAVRQVEPGHGLPAGRRLRGHALRPPALRAGRRAQRGRLRLLLRAALPHLRGDRHPVPRHLRRHAAGGPAHQHPGRAGAGAGRGGALARAAHAGPLRARAATWPGRRTRGRGGAGGRRATSRTILQGPAEVLLPGAGRPAAAGRRTGPAGTRRGERRSRSGRSTTVSRRAWAPTPCPARPRLYVPLRGTPVRPGRPGGPAADALLPLAPDQLDLLETLARQAASGLERVRLAEEAEAARLAVETRAAAEHAAELASPTTCARRWPPSPARPARCSSRQRWARRRGASAALTGGHLRRGRAPEPAGHEPARHDPPRVGLAAAQPRLAFPGGARGHGAGPARAGPRGPAGRRWRCRRTCPWCSWTAC